MFYTCRQGILQLQEIGTVCARALERQTRHTQLQQQSTATVLLDEGGLPGVSVAVGLPCLYVVTNSALQSLQSFIERSHTACKAASMSHL